MTDELIRLCDFVPNHSKTLGLDIRAAAYDLQELVQRLIEHHYVRNGPIIPTSVCWLGGVTDSRQSTRRYVIDFGMLSSYFKAWLHSPGEDGPVFRPEVEGEFKDVPARAIYFSKSGLIEWVESAGVEIPQFLEGRHSGGRALEAAEIEAFRAKELAYIQRLTQGLVNLLIEVNKAHCGPHLGKEANDQAKRVIRAASLINVADSASKRHDDIIHLAETAGIPDFPRSIKTIKKYMA
ncbi:hypothetical protein [Phytopseudomonas daroniae]|uniref:hypothetical protein n=1 Tax=Phytopseudomonas daroniae TaxID=2487519 RepID=UPI0010385BFD|nr:hypothetical protein [Pseudomonas daroniae]TBU77175.1 hypothetical protein DNK10_06605 [Pseudomonas daroniae]